MTEGLEERVTAVVVSKAMELPNLGEDSASWTRYLDIEPNLSSIKAVTYVVDGRECRGNLGIGFFADILLNNPEPIEVYANVTHVNGESYRVDKVIENYSSNSL
jgi:hypothetical protein